MANNRQALLLAVLIPESASLLPGYPSWVGLRGLPEVSVSAAGGRLTGKNAERANEALHPKGG